MVRHQTPDGARLWVYAKRVTGRFQRLHRASGFVLVAILAVVPWLNIGGQPVFRIDLPARHLSILGTVFTAADGFNLVLVALLAAFSLFFFTALLGRLWCGWTCPQTVFLEEFVRPVEQIFEGDRRVRMMRDAGGWTFDRAWRKVGKWTAFAALAFVVSMMVMSIFEDPRLLWTGQGGSADYMLVGILTAGLFLDWAWFREQLCIYLCPYARFQGALTDDHSLVVSYDEARGEPRGTGKAAASEGHCISCNKCVDVCPQGIDIRDGFQLECINCSRCVDACEDVMGKLGQTSLVRYSTHAADEGRKTRWVRARTLAYSAILLALTGGLTYRVATHSPLEATVNRMAGSLFIQDADGFVRNTYMVAVHNTDPTNAHEYTLEVRGLDDAQVTVPSLSLEP
ncbi:MAG: cytochrome c oxidase accessory protein CcoG, partial [Myxococcota bacterium]